MDSFGTLLRMLQLGWLAAFGGLLLFGLIAVWARLRLVTDHVSAGAKREWDPTGGAALGERRRAHRVTSHSRLEFEPDSAVPAECRLLNLSLSGACFASPVILSVGDVFHARLHSSKEGILRVSGQVVWREPMLHNARYGVRFLTVQALRSS